MAEVRDSFDLVASALAPLELSHIPNVKRDIVYEIGNIVEPLNGTLKSQEEQLSRLLSRTDARCTSISGDTDRLSLHVQSLEQRWAEDKEVFNRQLENVTEKLNSFVSVAERALEIAEKACADNLSLVADLGLATNRNLLLEQDMTRLEGLLTKIITREVAVSDAVGLETPGNAHLIAEMRHSSRSLYHELQEAQLPRKKVKNQRKELQLDETSPNSSVTAKFSPLRSFVAGIVELCKLTYPAQKLETPTPTPHDANGRVPWWTGNAPLSLSLVWEVSQSASQWISRSLKLLKTDDLYSSCKRLPVLSLSLVIIGALIWQLTASYHDYLIAQEDWDL